MNNNTPQLTTTLPRPINNNPPIRLTTGSGSYPTEMKGSSWQCHGQKKCCKTCFDTRPCVAKPDPEQSGQTNVHHPGAKQRSGNVWNPKNAWVPYLKRPFLIIFVVPKASQVWLIPWHTRPPQACSSKACSSPMQLPPSAWHQEAALKLDLNHVLSHVKPPWCT